MKITFIHYFAFIALITLCIDISCSSWISLLSWSAMIMCFLNGKLSSKKRNWYIATSLCLLAILTRGIFIQPSIEEGANVFIGGEKYSNSVFSKNLPKEIFDHLEKNFVKDFPSSISGPDIKLYDESVSKFWKKSSETRKVNFISWKNRYQLGLNAFNDGRYNAWGEQQPQRDNLPFFVKYSIPEKLSLHPDTELCWKGKAFTKQKDKTFVLIKNEKFNCTTTVNLYKDSNALEVWFVETNKTEPLAVSINLPKKYSIFFIAKEIIKVFSVFSIFLILIKNLHYKRSAFYIFSFVFSFVIMSIHTPTLLDKFILFEGGNDGLSYVHFAHLISDNIINNNFLLAFQGGENAYDLMPWYRYIWVFNYALFNESPWLPILTVSLFPIIIYELTKNLLGKKWSIALVFIWFFVPIFESFGFLHLYYSKLAVRGFAEPLSYLCFLTATLLICKITNKKNIYSSFASNLQVIFFIGALFALSIGIRANVLFGAIILLVFFSSILLVNKEWKKLFILFVGFSPISLVPIHNYIFTNKFIPLTIAAYKDWNLGVKPADYFNVFLSIISINPDKVIINKILNHLGDEINPNEFWYHITILVCVYFIFNNRFNYIKRTIAVSALSLQSMTLFYHVGGRYGYLCWTLTLFIFLIWSKEQLIPYLKVKLKNKKTI